MAIATTVSRATYNNGFQGTVNLRVASTAGILVTTPLTIGGDLVVTPIHELPFGAWKCEITGTPRGSNRMIIRAGDTVTG
jgi:hypothetical protein